jgi:hypothetical protein
LPLWFGDTLVFTPLFRTIVFQDSMGEAIANRLIVSDVLSSFRTILAGGADPVWGSLFRPVF